AGRVYDMLRTAGARLVVTAGEWAGRVGDLAEVVGPDTGPDAPGTRPAVPVSAADLAQVIFTSGSTGTPKGVAVSHGGLAYRVSALTARMPQAAGGSFAVLSTLAADLSLTALYGAWLTGGTLHLTDRETATDAAAWARYLARHRVDTVKLVPSHLRMLARDGALAAVLPRTLLVLGGEGCPWSLVSEIRRARPDLAVHTHYGPTEATMMSLVHDVDEVPEARRTGLVPLGRPLPGVVGRIVDRAGRPQVPGVPGELLLGGPGVARGYTGRPDLTAERFAEDAEGGRWYRTGDLVRLADDGEVDFLGRRDDQVKVRGHRVEPGEVVAALRALPEVADAVVLPEGEGPTGHLVAWIVAAPGHGPRPGQVRARLGASLPHHMVPAEVTVVDRIPLTPQGKPDRAALRRAARPARAEAAGEAPSTAAERAVAEVWQTLLGPRRISVTDDFFALGGHSFTATRMVGLLAGSTGRTLPVRSVFERPVLRDLAAELERRGREAEGPDQAATTGDTGAAGQRTGRGAATAAAGPGGDRPGTGPVAAPDGPAPLSPARRRMWLLWRLRPDSDAYHLHLALRLNGPLDMAALRVAVRGLGERHPVLGTAVAEDEAGPRAVPLPPEAIPVTLVDVGPDEADTALRAEAARPFALDRETPFRAVVLRVSGHEHVLLLTAHHIACDAWSWTTLLRDLSSFYREAAGPGPAPRRIPAPVRSGAPAPRPGVEARRHLDWWAAHLADLPVLALPADRPRGPGAGWAARSEPVALSAATTAGLRAFAAELDCTPFMVLLTVWQSLLGRLAATEDVPVGVPVSGRAHPGAGDEVGCFADTVVLRGDLSGDPTVREAAARTRARTLDALARATTPFQDVVARLDPVRDPDATPLFQALLNVIGLPPLPGRFAELTATRVDIPRTQAQTDLALTLVDDGLTLTGTLAYRAGLFDRATVRRWNRWFTALLDAALAAPDQPLLALDPLSDGERAQLRSAGTGAALPAHRPATVVGAVLGQAARRPDATAVVTAGGALSYRELDAWSASLARTLAAHGVRPGEPVGVHVPRDLRLGPALLGVLRAGAAYVPLDPDHPAGRLAVLVADAGIRLVLSGGPAPALPGVTVVDVGEDAGRDTPLAAPLPEPDPGRAAYVQFTSGTTGRPKGVVVTHANLAAFVAALRADPGMSPDDVTLGAVPFGFDVFGYELWVTLASGARLALADRDTVADGHALAAWIRRHGVTVATATPTVLRLLSAADLPADPGLRVISIGEVLEPPLAADLLRRAGRLWNAYGPTETTVYSTLAEVCAPVDEERPVPVGGPIAGTRVHLLDRRGRPALPG
ncbi:AMP-binding protein, partial [Streptomyces ziwulingensis]|uniref:AMP-binding protein n=1 Tax=Streptomyces ziwulingensis TaxID=1045501 RepID=UPI0031E5DEE1